MPLIKFDFTKINDVNTSPKTIVASATTPGLTISLPVTIGLPNVLGFNDLELVHYKHYFNKNMSKFELSLGIFCTNTSMSRPKFA
jgi:hypothetical protein